LGFGVWGLGFMGWSAGFRDFGLGVAATQVRTIISTG
jgi:hypothetical protein